MPKPTDLYDEWVRSRVGSPLNISYRDWLESQLHTARYNLTTLRQQAADDRVLITYLEEKLSQDADLLLILAAEQH